MGVVGEDLAGWVEDVRVLSVRVLGVDLVVDRHMEWMDG
jgi:hypothetical protein